jgi:sulfatase maturation enzyme AslB (radical SAM superfamily)
MGNNIGLYCARPWASMMLFPCAAGPECNISFKIRKNYKTPTIDEIWNGPEMVSIRRQVREGNAKALGCSDCAYFGSGSSLYELFEYKDAPDNVQKNAKLNVSEFFKGQLILKSKPLYISADLSYACNLECVLCELRFDKNELVPHQLSDLFTKHAGTLRHMHISGGEPLMNAVFLRYLKKPQMKPHALSITTNGTLLSEKILGNLAQFQYINLHISFDSFNELTLKKLRAGSDYNLIIKNIQRALKYRNKINKDFGTKHWHVCLQIVPTILNFHEFPDYLDRVNDFGVDSINFCSISGDFPELDFIRYPRLLDRIDVPSLLYDINSRLNKYSHLEINGLEPALKGLKDKVGDLALNVQ